MIDRPTLVVIGILLAYGVVRDRVFSALRERARREENVERLKRGEPPIGGGG
jgi:hypothetical protein